MIGNDEKRHLETPKLAGSSSPKYIATPVLEATLGRVPWQEVVYGFGVIKMPRRLS